LNLRYGLLVGDRLEIGDIVVAFDDAADNEAGKNKRGDCCGPFGSGSARGRNFAMYVHR
jgi:hypothetical protein